MDKEEIVSKIDSLARRVKTRGRAYSKAQREEMRNQISILEIELAKIEFEEDLVFINDFLVKHPSHLIPEQEALKNKFDGLVNYITDQNLSFVLEFKIKSFNSEYSYLSSDQKTIKELIEALDFLNKNEKIPSTNPNYYKKKEEIQKSLARSLRALDSKKSKLNVALNEIQIIINFFINDHKLTGFIYLSDAIFNEASDFDNGYASVMQESKKMYYSFTGRAYNIDTRESEIPRFEKPRLNPDLVPFEINDDTFSRLYGYKNSKNEIIIPAKFKHASSFINGYAKVGILKRDHMFYGLIDSQGRLVLPCDFIEINNVYNDIVLYKKHIYREGYVRTSSFSFDMRHEVKHLGLFSGYLIYDEIKPEIQKQIENIKEIKSSIPSLKTNGELDNAHEKIKKHRDKIDFYLKYITDNQND